MTAKPECVSRLEGDVCRNGRSKADTCTKKTLKLPLFIFVTTHLTILICKLAFLHVPDNKLHLYIFIFKAVEFSTLLS